MASDLSQTLGDVKRCWMIGGSALERAPATWRAASQDDPNPDLVLLTLAGQAMQFAMRPAPGGELTTLQPLPRLNFPTPPQQTRQQFRSLVRISKLNESQISIVIHLLAARGYVIHPADYMPRSFSRLPDVYQPWAAWQRAEALSREPNASTTIDAGNWDEWMPAERRTALATLRREQPDSARELIAANVPSLSADERFRVLEVLGETLCTEDQSLLERFANDRSVKIRELVGQYLARIGIAEHEPAEVTEYAEFFTVVKTRGGYQTRANELKTQAQRRRRDQLAAKLSLHSLVQGLQLASETELLSGWEHVDAEASDALVRMVAATGSDQAASLLASRITELAGISAESLQLLINRLGKESRRELLSLVLKNDDAQLSAALICSQGLWGEIPLELLTSLEALKKLKTLATQIQSSSPAKRETLRQGLFTLGVLADQAAARELLKLFTNTDLFASDPMLGPLNLNASLPPGECL